MIANTIIDGFTVYYRQNTCDQDVLMHSFGRDIFFSNVPEYVPGTKDVIIDIGAHIGTFSLLAATKARRGHVYAIEACKETFDILKSNIQCNNLTNIHPSHFALSGSKSTTKLYYDLKSGNWGHSIVKAFSEDGENVQTDTLGNFMVDNGIIRCNFLKSNCEGAEFDIFLNTPIDTLKKIDTLLILYHLDLAENHTDVELIKHLRSAGFSIVVRKIEDEGQRGWLVARHNLHFPQISITIPCYNHAHFLKDALSSLINQTFQGWEAIIVDDGSTEGDPDQVVRLFDDRRINLVRHQYNKGLAASRNTGFSISNAPFVLVLDADDALSYDFLDKTYTTLKQDNSIDCVFTDFKLFGDSDYCWKNECRNFKDMAASQWIPGSGTLLKKMLWEEVGGYCESSVLRYGNEDWDFWLSAIEKKIIVQHVNEAVYFYRRNAGTLSNNLAYMDFATRLFIYERHKHFFDAVGKKNVFLRDGFLNSSRESWKRNERTRCLILSSKASYYNGDIHRGKYSTSSIESNLAAYIQLIENICDDNILLSFGDFVSNITTDNTATNDFKSYLPDWDQYDQINDSIMTCIASNRVQLLVSILIPCYNYAHFLKECLESVVAQTYPHWEAIVVDDASNDNPEAVVRTFNDRRIHFYKHNVNRGGGAAFNTAFNHSKGELVVIVSADDFIKADFLEKTTKSLINNPDVDVAFSDVQLFGNKSDVWKFSVLTERDMTLKQWVTGGGSVMRRDIWERGGGHCENREYLPANLDWDFWLSCIPFVRRVTHIAEPLYYYRIHGKSSLSSQLSLNDFATREIIYLRHKALFEKYGTGNEFRADGYYRSAKASWKTQHFFRSGVLVAHAWKLRNNIDTVMTLSSGDANNITPIMIKLMQHLDASCVVDTPWIDDLRSWEMFGNLAAHVFATGFAATLALYSALNETEPLPSILAELYEKSPRLKSEMERYEF